MIRRFPATILVALIVALALSACGGGGAPAAGARTINVETAEFSFTPNTFTAKVGEALTFAVSNKGVLDHNFVVFDPSGAEIGRGTIATGATGNVTVTPGAAGDYRIVCDVAGHEDSGMVATLTVSQ